MDEILSGRYRLDRELGRGGIGEVWAAFDTVLERSVAVKVLSEAGLSSEGRARLLAEARASARLNHPNIAAVYDAGEADGRGYIVMELVIGQSLHELAPRDLATILSIAQQVCLALGHAHRHGIVHRDLKPENILITGEGSVKLVDFGLARSIASRLSVAGELVGTVYYLAPEQATGQAVDGRADLYALGVILYEQTTGQLPFRGEDPLAVVSQHLYAPVVPPRTRVPNLLPALDTLIVRLLSKSPDDRPATAEEVGLQIDQVLAEGQAGVAQPAPAPLSNLSLLERITRGRLVGRKQERAQARSLWHRAMAGQGQTLLVTGEPGVGKTRLVRELAAEAQVGGGKVLSTSCYPEGGAPYAPVVRAIRGLREDLATLGLPEYALAGLISLAPELVSQIQQAPFNPPLDPQGEEDRLHESLSSLLGALSGRVPVMFFVDDIHWADAATLYLLRHLARQAGRLRLLLVLTYRDVEMEEIGPLHSVILDMNRERLATRLKLGRLTQEQTREMLESMFEGQIAETLVEGVYRETEGNPFFVEEVCKALVEDGDLVYEQDHWHSAGSLEDLHIPQSVKQAIQARIARLPDGAQNVLLMAAVQGRTFDFEVLRSSGHWGEEELLSWLESAERAQLIEELMPGQAGQQPGTDRMGFAFAHALIPATLRESVSGLRRQRLHRKTGEALQQLQPDNLESLAYQYAQAGDEVQARGYYVQAGDRAARVPAMRDAARNYQAALEGWPEADRAGRAALLQKLGTCLWLTGSPQKTREVLDQARDLFQALGDRVKVGDAERMIGRLYWEMGNRGAALEHYQQALGILEAEPESVELARAISSISQMHMLASQYDEAINWGERALALGRQLGAQDVVVHALNNVGSAYGLKGQFERGLTMLRESLRLATEANLPHDICRAGLNLGEGLAAFGHYAEAEKVIEEMVAYADIHFFIRDVRSGLVVLVNLDWMLGRWTSALARRAKISSSHPARVMSDLWAHTLFGHIDNDLGRSAETLTCLEPDMKIALESDEIQTTIPFLGELLRAFGELGRNERAAELARLMLDRISRSPYVEADTVMSSLSGCYWAGHAGGSEYSHLVPEFLAQIERGDRQYHNPETKAALAEAQAILLEEEGNWFGALEKLGEASRIWGETGRPFDRARSLVEAARVAEKADRLAEAAESAGQAELLLGNLAAQLDANDLRPALLSSRLVREAHRLTRSS